MKYRTVKTLPVAAAVLLLGGCTLPYQPARADVGPLPEDAFDRTLAVVRATYPRLEVVDREGFRIQSAWIPFQQGDLPGHRRATLFLDGPSSVGVVVEARYLHLDLFGRPVWTSPRGDPTFERELLAAVVHTLGAEP